MLCGPIGKIGFMHGDDLGLGCGNSLERFIQVIGMCINVVDAHDPDSPTISFQRQRLIAQNLETMAIECIGDSIGTVPMVVVTENRHHPSSWQSPGQLLQDFGAWLGVTGALRSIGQSKRVRNEIAAKNGEIRF